jgi:HAMP domain-containing protein
MMLRFFSRLSLGTQFGLLLAILMGFVSVAGSIVGRSIVESQVLNESRSIADMTEHIGSWAAKYSGLHVKTVPGKTIQVGEYLQRSMYAVNDSDHKALMGMRMNEIGSQGSAVNRTEAYHWKNPALIQREVSDVAMARGGKVQFRITAASVMNPHNAPDAFEQKAIKEINISYNERIKRGEKAATYNGTAASGSGGPAEYWSVENGVMRYTRAIITAKSCLNCHNSKEAAPEFLKSNMSFNGGGGFGYKEGQPDGIISVKIPIPDSLQALTASMTAVGWAALGAIVFVCLLILVFVVQKIIRPINRLRVFAEKLSNTSVGQNFDVPQFMEGQQKSTNEVHQLANAIGELGESVKILFQKLQKTRK